MLLNFKTLSSYFDCDYFDFEFSALITLDIEIPNSISFLDDLKFFNFVVNNPNIKGLVTLKQFADEIAVQRPDILCFLSQDPRFDFFLIHNSIANNRLGSLKFKSKIDTTARIHPRSFIDEHSVIIGKHVIIEPNVTILPNVEVLENAVIRAGTVLGSEGFEYKKTSKGILSVTHDGKVVIGKNVEIGANCAIDKGFYFKDTIIGENTKIDNLVHIAHSVNIGKNCFIAGGSVIAGSTTIKDNVWVGPNSSLSNNIVVNTGSYVSIGSVVINGIKENSKVFGNPARTIKF